FEPLRIEFYPDDVLEVITDVQATRNLDSEASNLHPSSSTSLQSFNSSQIAGEFEQVAISKSNIALNLKAIENHMAVSNENSQEIKTLLLEVKEKDNQIHLMQNQLLDLQQQALDRLTIIQKHAHAILVQNFELHEYPIPRLFIILPVEKSKWDPTRILENKLRLHFLCECGDHTIDAIKSSENQIHIAKHEGYGIKNGTEFFKKYGKYMLILMRALKLGVQSANISMPHIPVTKLVDAGIDYSISYMETLSVANPVLDSINTIDDYEGLEGADLRQLDTFLRVNDQEKELGNLYRITTEAGHVKWVCTDHYRATYKEKDQKAFTDIVEANGGKYDEKLGRVVISLGSRIRAQEFFDAIPKARHVYDLDVTFGWNCSTSDLEALEKALRVSNVSILRLDLQQFQASFTKKILSTSTQHEKIVRIIEHTNMRIARILLSKDFMKLISLHRIRSSHLRKLSSEMTARQIGRDDFRVLVNSLGVNNTLTTLNLRYNSIGKQGAITLSEALKTNNTLTTLNLESNSIGKEGALALSEALKTNTTLNTLDLESNSIGKEGALALSKALKTNTTLVALNLRYNSIGREGALALSEALKTNNTLTNLNLRYNSIGKEGALALSETLKINTTLTTLDLWRNSIGDEGAIALSEALKPNTALTTLNLESNSIGKEGTIAISEALKINTILTTLNLEANTIGKEGALAISKALNTNVTLTNLNLSVNSIGKEGALAISEALKSNNTLTALNLRNNLIRNEGALAILEALKFNTTLTTLNLEGNSIGKEGAPALSEALKANNSLIILNLEGNSIGKEGALAISEALKNNTTLITLNLRNNMIKDEGANAVSEVLKTNTTLTTLNLRYNSIGNEGAFSLSEALKINPTLTTLNLEDNPIGKEGYLALSEALKYNTNLTISR
ncbi:hypothetical protein BGZ46_000404, partial [Entomortierella lignicola]